jgi:hypothetical protein
LICIKLKEKPIRVLLKIKGTYFLFRASIFALDLLGKLFLSGKSFLRLSLKTLSFGPSAPWCFSMMGSGPSHLSFGPATPWYSSSAGFGPSNYFLLASSASNLFEDGFWSLESLLRANSASVLFECGFRSLELFSLGQQCLRVIRRWVLISRITFFGPAEPLHYLGIGARTLVSCLPIAEVRIWADIQPNLSRAVNAPHSTCPNLGGNIPVWMLYVKCEGKSTVYNTPVGPYSYQTRSAGNFPYLRYEVCTDGHIGCLTLNWAST